MIGLEIEEKDHRRSSIWKKQLIGLTWKIIQPFLRDHRGQIKKKSAILWIFLVAGISLWNAVLASFSYWQNDYMSSIAEKNVQEFNQCVIRFFAIVCVIVPIHLFRSYTQEYLVISWQRALTEELLQYYYTDKRYYRIMTDFPDVDNIDQRIQADTQNFTDKVVQLIASLVDSIIGFGTFSLILYSISPLLCFISLLYAGFASGLGVYCFGPTFTRIKTHLIQTSADFRYTLARTRENVESIAFYNGGEKEYEISTRLFMRWLKVQFRNLRWSVGYKVFSTGYLRFTYLLPPLVVAPRFFRDEIKFGVIAQASLSLRMITDSLAFVILELEDLSDLQAQGTRLVRSLDVVKCRLSMRRIECDRVPLQDSNELFVFRNLTVYAPGRNEKPLILLKDLSIAVSKSDRVLIMGENGCGKSTILRVLCDLFVEGSGYFQAPSLEDIVFIPQNSYFTNGNLREQILYPDVTSSSTDDKTFLEYLRLVNLEKLFHIHGFNQEKNWTSFLSNGEKQRLAFTRIFSHCNKKLVVLDEATSALDPQAENEMYSLLAERHLNRSPRNIAQTSYKTPSVLWEVGTL